jgi:hypothetical protein
MPNNELILPEIEGLSKIVKEFTKTKDILEDIEERFPTKVALEKQKMDPIQVDFSKLTPETEGTLEVSNNTLLDVNKELLDVTQHDVVGSIEELTDLFKDGIPVSQPGGLVPAEDREDLSMQMLKSIQSIEQGDAFTKQPEFLQFMEEQDQNARELIKGTEEERALGFELLGALRKLSEDNKESISMLMKQQEKADRKSFKDVAKGIAGRIPGMGSLKDIGIAKALEGALIAGIAGWEIGKRLEVWMNENWQIRDMFANAMDSITETFFDFTTKLELGKQVLSPEEQEKNIRIEARKELIKEMDVRIKQVQERTDIDAATKDALIKTKEEQILKLQRQVGELATVDVGKLTEPDSPLVLEKIREIGKRERAAQIGAPELGAARNLERGLDNRANEVFRQEVRREREPIVPQPQTTVVPVPVPNTPRPAPQKQIDDFGTLMMHLFLQ